MKKRVRPVRSKRVNLEKTARPEAKKQYDMDDIYADLVKLYEKDTEGFFLDEEGVEEEVKAADMPRRTKVSKRVRSSRRTLRRHAAPLHAGAMKKDPGRILNWFLHMDRYEKLALATGLVVVLVAGTFSAFYLQVRAQANQVNSFAEVGSQLDGVGIVGEKGLVAIADSEKSRLEAAKALAAANAEASKKKGEVKVVMTLTSIQNDLKVKFINKEEDRRIKDVPFEIEITDPSGNTKTHNDHDQDGIYYEKDLKAGTYKVKMLDLPKGYEKYEIDSEVKSVKVKDTIAYEKVDVADEIKDESEVNVAAEDTQQQNTPVESQNTDTVEWVESSKTQVDEGTPNAMPGDGSGYEAIGKDQIADPYAQAMLRSSDFAPLAARSVRSSASSAQTAAEADASKSDAGYKLENKGKSSYILNNGDSVDVGINASPEGGDPGFDVSSSDSDVATGEKTDGGIRINAIAPGSATIQVTYAGQELAISVTVNEVAKPRLDVTPEQLSLSEGSESQLSAKVSNQDDTSVKWSVTQGSDIVSVDGNGKVHALKSGSAVVRATSSSNADLWDESRITVSADPRKDGQALKTKDGRQVYIQKNGNYLAATNADYRTADGFYVQTSGSAWYVYTGWQTLKGSTYYFDKNGAKVTGDQIINGAKYSFSSEGVLAAGSGNMGIDVSKWNGNIDWKAVRASGVSYVIIRCGYRGSSTGALIEDPRFRQNIRGAAAAGLHVGVYFFTQAVNEVEAVEEASMVSSLIRGYNLSFPVFLDVESSGGRADGISTDMRTKVCKAFCATMANAGYRTGIYANRTWLNSRINVSQLTAYKIWLAQYAKTPSYSRSRYDMWQYTSKGRINGIAGYVDMNISYM